jgi:hypothetical protein
MESTLTTFIKLGIGGDLHQLSDMLDTVNFEVL